MKKFFSIFIISVLIVFLILPAQSQESEKKTDITGYGDITLGMTEEDFLALYPDAEGPIPDIEGIFDYSVDDHFALENFATDVVVNEMFIDGEIGGISISFPNFYIDSGGDLEVASFVVKELRQTTQDSYDTSSMDIEENMFTWHYNSNSNIGWRGRYAMRDSDEDLYLITWDGFDLNMYYFTSEMRDILESYNEESQESTAEKL